MQVKYTCILKRMRLIWIRKYASDSSMIFCKQKTYIEWWDPQFFLCFMMKTRGRRYCTVMMGGTIWCKCCNAGGDVCIWQGTLIIVNINQFFCILVIDNPPIVPMGCLNWLETLTWGGSTQGIWIYHPQMTQVNIKLMLLVVRGGDCGLEPEGSDTIKAAAKIKPFTVGT